MKEHQRFYSVSFYPSNKTEGKREGKTRTAVPLCKRKKRKGGGGKRRPPWTDPEKKDSLGAPHDFDKKRNTVGGGESRRRSQKSIKRRQRNHGKREKGPIPERGGNLENPGILKKAKRNQENVVFFDS